MHMSVLWVLGLTLWLVAACAMPPPPTEPGAVQTPPGKVPASSTDRPPGTETPAPSAKLTAAPLTPVAVLQGEKPTMTPTPSVPPDLLSLPQVALAKADLARRLGTSPDQIQVVQVEMVVWPDQGLGCPQPGMAYLQVPVDGLRILLAHGGRTYAYHSGGLRPPFLCENP